MSCRAWQAGRRGLLAALAAAALPSRAAPEPVRIQARRLALPEPIGQIAQGEGDGLLAVGRSGRLWQFALRHGTTRQLGEALDADTPLASGHGRIAGRRSDGALWLLEGGHVRSAPGTTLAPAAGLLVLPAGLIAIESVLRSQRPVRLEADGSGDWRVVARGAIDVLPDAHAIQAAVDGESDGGHIVLLAGPDAERYPHGVLGDAIEATRIVYLERHSLEPIRELLLPAPHVLEDIAPRRIARKSGDVLLTVMSGPQGGQLVLVGAAPASGALAIVARGEPLGTRARWLSPTTDGRHLLAVHTPHLGGVLHEYRQEGQRLTARRVAGDLSNHRIGSRVLDIGCWSSGRLLLPDQSGMRLRLLDSGRGFAPVAEADLPSPVVACVALGAPGRHAALLHDGQVLLLDTAP